MATLRKWGESGGGDNETAESAEMGAVFDAYLQQIRIDLGITADDHQLTNLSVRGWSR